MQKATFPSDLRSDVCVTLWSSLFLSCVTFACLVCTLLFHPSAFLGKWHHAVKLLFSAVQSRSVIKHRTELLISCLCKAPFLLWCIWFFPLALSHFLEGLKFKVSTFLKMTIPLISSFCWLTPVLKVECWSRGWWPACGRTCSLSWFALSLPTFTPFKAGISSLWPQLPVPIGRRPS